ncbi:MAG: glycosyltransferase [Candidatus Bathyarchaeia archaeon]
MGELRGLRAYFSPCGIGLGHVGRCYPIAEELLRREATILFSTYSEGADYVRKLGFPLVESPSIGFSIDWTGKVDLKGTSTQTLTAIPRFLVQINAEIEHIRSFKPDIVISDSRLSSLVAAKLLNIPTILILNQFHPILPREKRFFNLSKIADGGILALVGEGWGLSDRILIPDFPPPYTISLGNLRIPKRFMSSVRFIGTILAKRASEGDSGSRLRGKLGVGGGKNLIFVPISGPREEKQPLIEGLRRIFEEFPREYHVVMSLGEVKGGSTPEKRGTLTIIPWITDRFNYLKACDLVISRGGHGTIMQSISFGKPQIIVPTPGHTEKYSNARRALELGVAEVIEEEELTRERLLSTIEKMLDQGVHSVNLRKIRDENRLDAVANAIEEIRGLLDHSTASRLIS